jgi:uncharacterized repeat protein (TIGR03803 family)
MKIRKTKTSTLKRNMKFTRSNPSACRTAAGRFMCFTIAGSLALLLAIPLSSHADRLFVSTYDNTILEFDTFTGSNTVFASSGVNYPSFLTLDNAGNLYVANPGNNTIEKFDTSSGVGTVFASSGLNSPQGMAFDNSTNLYVASAFDNAVKKITPSGTVTVLATAGLHVPIGLAFDGLTHLYVGSQNPGSGNSTIETVRLIGGSGLFASGLNYPAGIAFDSAGNLYVANDGDNTIVRFNNPPAGPRTVFASAGLHNPLGLAFDSAGNLFVANGGDGTIEKFNPLGAGTVFASGLNNPYGLAILPTAPASIQPIYSFTNTPANPFAGLTLGPDGNFYGTTRSVGRRDYGTVFRVTTNGVLTALLSFANTNGADPLASLTQGLDGDFYGTTGTGGSSPSGTVFQVTTNGVLTTLVNFALTNGATPVAGLTPGPDGNFYGTTVGGGGGYGTVFRVTTNGVLTTLVSFANTNGANSSAGLTMGPDGNFYGTTGGFYGTTGGGGSSGYGTVFRVTTNGVLTSLASLTNTNGANPYSALTLGPDGNFYGTTVYGGSSGIGTVFRVTTNGVMTMLVSFANTNGANPYSALTLGPDGNFYGTAYSGGTGGGGVIYRLNLPPSITTQPSDFVTSVGGTASFTATPFGTAPFSYQWLSNGVPITGATNSQLTVQNITIAVTNTQFQVFINNTWGSVTTSVAVIDVSPVIDTQPADQTQIVGNKATFAASVSGTLPLAYQWYFDNAVLTGATNSTLTLYPVSAGATGSYQLIVTNAGGSATSRVASLTVLLQPNPYGISSSNGGKMNLNLASIPGSTNRLWTTTNITLPMTQWQIIATNVMDSNGFSQVTDTNTSPFKAKYYRLSMP